MCYFLRFGLRSIKNVTQFDKNIFDDHPISVFMLCNKLDLIFHVCLRIFISYYRVQQRVVWRVHRVKYDF
jgi:hypothetical protein